MIPDQSIRAQALDPTQSFIVRAPAGSGKTELLTQRFLKLLAQVEHPQAVLAITFTKKAAQEMRHRILKSLADAQQDTVPESQHARTTQQLARAVLARDKALNWQLLAYPHRLSIQTIDALCMSLVRQMPMASGLGASAQIVERSDKNYRDAAYQMLHFAAEHDDYKTAVSDLLHHFDNEYDKILTVLVDLLKKRDQWAPLLFNKSWPQLQAHLQQSLEITINDALERAHALFPPEKMDLSVALANFAAQNLADDSLLCYCRKLFEFPTPTHEHHATWQGIVALLLTQKSEFRKKIDKSDGFPLPKGSLDPVLYKAMKDDMLALLADLRGNDELRQALADIQLLPPPYYSQAQWEFLQAICHLLPLLLAQLQVIFAQENKLDFSEIALRAITALGTEQAPTDLALRLDYRIEHILVDEFQDTNLVQFSLLEKLTHGWQCDDGRTLFLVGDPMQSIYRFREANVGLFLQVSAQGLRDLPIQPLTLLANFRSANLLVDWVNNTFSHILPKQADMNCGAIPFANAIATRLDLVGCTPALLVRQTRTAEAQTLVETIIALRAKEPNASIAILVRARQHLADIIPLLQSKKIIYEAVELEHLAQQSVIKDLLALTKALLHIDDTVAWLAVLRAPWCGLSLNDLHQLRHGNLSTSLFANLQNATIVETLSFEGQIRVRRLLMAITPCIPVQRFALAWAVEKTWLALGGSASVDENALHNAYHYFKFLQKISSENPIVDAFLLDKELANLFAQTANPAQNAIQVMTIHKSKGLEFDYVLVPGLDRVNNAKDTSLLRWSVQQQHEQKHLLLGVRHEKIGERDPLYDFLGEKNSKQERFEMQRLLYVAVTRAKKGWYGFAVMEPEQEEPKANSFFALLWPVAAAQAVIAWGERQEISANLPTEKNNLTRLPVDWQLPAFIQNLITEPCSVEKVVLNTDNRVATWQRAVGIVVHRLLAQAANKGSNVIANAPHYWSALLREQAVLDADLPQALDCIAQAVKTIAIDPRAQWILADHQQGKAEYALQTFYQNEFHSVVLDRTFIDDEVRWIIDYKITHAPHEIQNYEKQLNHYATLFRQFEARPIRLGLYFPLQGEWEELPLQG